MVFQPLQYMWSWKNTSYPQSLTYFLPIALPSASMCPLAHLPENLGSISPKTALHYTARRH